MQQFLVRQIIAPLLERMLGRRTFRNLAELERQQWWSGKQIRDLQRRKLRELLEGAGSASYYARLFAERGLNPRIDDPFMVLRALPLLDKETIRTYLDEMTNVAVPGGVRSFNTGGSTGQPLTFFIDRRRVGYDKAARMLTHGWFGARPGDRELYLWGSPIELTGQDEIKRWRDWLTNELLLDAFDLSAASMDAYIERIRRFDPVSIFGYPSSLVMLAEYAESQGLSLANRSLKAVFVTGEQLDCHQRQTLEGHFEAPVANGYGSRDGGFIAHECERGAMHVIEPNIIIEIVDEDGDTAPAGAVGEIVITHLDAHATPFIRYRTGDMGRLVDDRCRCGRLLACLDVSAGRKTDHLVAADGKLEHALAAIYVLREMPTVGRFRIHQHRDLRVDVEVVAVGRFGSADRERIVRGLQRRLGATIPVSVNVVDAIACTGSGKFRQVVSEAVGHFSPAEKVDWVMEEHTQELQAV